MTTATPKVTPKKRKTYELLRSKPVARFYYQGSHSHPVRRTVLLIEERANLLIGYEFRCGKNVRTRAEAVSEIKSYRKDKIANWGDYSRLTMSSANFMKDPNASTLERFPLNDFIETGA